MNLPSAAPLQGAASQVLHLLDPLMQVRLNLTPPAQSLLLLLRFFNSPVMIQNSTP
jgi:hypothetical protein